MKNRYYHRCLTNEGYNFLDAAKNDTLWNKVKAEIAEKGLSVSLDLLRKLL